MSSPATIPTTVGKNEKSKMPVSSVLFFSCLKMKKSTIKRIDVLEKELELLRTEIRYLKYVWELKEIEERGKESHTTVYVDTHKK